MHNHNVNHTGNGTFVVTGTCVDKLEKFNSAMEFSIETSSTIGYGGVAPGQFSATLQENIRNNFASGLTTLIVTPIAFKVISKLAAKPRREFNKVAKMVGLPISM